MMNWTVLGILAVCLLVLGCERSAVSAGGTGGGGDEPAHSASGAGSGTRPASGPASAVGTIEKTDAQWREQLTAEEYRVLRQKGTERAFTGKYDHHFEKGAYSCAACGLELFTSDTKFDSGCGWPAFYAAKAGDRVKLTPDYSYGMTRVEVTCARCGGHLGHVFDDAPDKPTGQRYCINSVSIKFTPAGEAKAAKEQ